MIIINVKKKFEQAVIEKNVSKVEEILSSSDRRIELIEEFSNYRDLSMLTEIVLQFRSIGLITDIENHCNTVKNKKNDLIDENKKFKVFKTSYSDQENIDKNKKNYFREDQNKIIKKEIIKINRKDFLQKKLVI